MIHQQEAVHVDGGRAVVTIHHFPTANGAMPWHVELTHPDDAAECWPAPSLAHAERHYARCIAQIAAYDDSDDSDDSDD
jgi:hypothetical protein